MQLWMPVRQNKKLSTVVLLLRYLLGYAFIPSGIKKILGERFTSIGIDNPVGFFFEGLYRSGYYWNFLGWGQLLAAFLLMTQRFSTLGNLLFFFIVTNICAITVFMHFQGTWLITSLMLFASFCLLLWDFHKLQFIFQKDNFTVKVSFQNLPTYNLRWIVSGLLLFALSVLESLVTVQGIKATTQFICFAVIAIIIVLITLIFEWKRNKKID